MPIHLRGEKCALRGAFLRWMLFNALLAFASFLFQIYASEIYEPQLYGYWLMMEPIFGGPERMVEVILVRSVPGFYVWWGKSWVTLLFWVLAALRLGAVFAWGVARLRRGKYAPYAEALWLIVICAFATKWLLDGHPYVLFYVLQALLAIAGIVIFVLQRRRPPAWKWKMRE